LQNIGLCVGYFELERLRGDRSRLLIAGSKSEITQLQPHLPARVMVAGEAGCLKAVASRVGYQGALSKSLHCLLTNRRRSLIHARPASFRNLDKGQSGLTLSSLFAPGPQDRPVYLHPPYFIVPPCSSELKIPDPFSEVSTKEPSLLSRLKPNKSPALISKWPDAQESVGKHCCKIGE
jgi:hypothetical protein